VYNSTASKSSRLQIITYQTSFRYIRPQTQDKTIYSYTSQIEQKRQNVWASPRHWKVLKIIEKMEKSAFIGHLRWVHKHEKTTMTSEFSKGSGNILKLASPQSNLRRVHHKEPIGYNGTPQIHPQNCPFPFDDHHIHLIHPSVDRPHSPSQTASGSNQQFCHNTLSGETDRQTDRQIG